MDTFRGVFFLPCKHLRVFKALDYIFFSASLPGGEDAENLGLSQKTSLHNYKKKTNNTFYSILVLKQANQMEGKNVIRTCS